MVGIMGKKLTLKEMQKLAVSKGGKCLSKKYMHSQIKLKWRCKEGHVWEAIPNNIKSGHWCPVCGRIKEVNKRRLSIEEMQNIAREKGGECLSKEYVDVRTKLRWRCKEGHEWKATPNSIKRGSWCRICSYSKIGEKRRLTIEEMQGIAKARGGDCLSKKYINVNTKLRWRCKERHVWEANLYNIRGGGWCPICSRIKRVEACRLVLKKMQHIARERGGGCSSKKYVNSQTKLKWICKEGHVWKTTPEVIKRGHWCPICSYNKVSEAQRLIFEKAQDIARERGGKCLSKEYANKYTKLQWECKKGHRWEAHPRHMKKGSWCRICSYTKMGKERRLTIEEMQGIAKARGGECLSKDYVNSQTRLRWRCKEGHEWKATPNSIKGGKWCPTCAWKKRIKKK